MMEFPERIFWRPISAAPCDLIPVLVWDGFRYWIACRREDGSFIEQETEETVYAVCWADIPSPPAIAPQPGPR